MALDINFVPGTPSPPYRPNDLVTFGFVSVLIICVVIKTEEYRVLCRATVVKACRWSTQRIGEMRPCVYSFFKLERVWYYPSAVLAWCILRCLIMKLMMIFFLLTGDDSLFCRRWKASRMTSVNIMSPNKRRKHLYKESLFLCVSSKTSCITTTTTTTRLWCIGRKNNNVINVLTRSQGRWEQVDAVSAGRFGVMSLLTARELIF